MMYRWLADVTVTIHFAFLLFVLPRLHATRLTAH